MKDVFLWMASRTTGEDDYEIYFLTEIQHLEGSTEHQITRSSTRRKKSDEKNVKNKKNEERNPIKLKHDYLSSVRQLLFVVMRGTRMLILAHRTQKANNRRRLKWNFLGLQAKIPNSLCFLFFSSLLKIDSVFNLLIVKKIFVLMSSTNQKSLFSFSLSILDGKAFNRFNIESNWVEEEKKMPYDKRGDGEKRVENTFFWEIGRKFQAIDLVRKREWSSEIIKQ